MGGCCNKDDDTSTKTITAEDQSNDANFKRFIVANRWKLTRFIGKGSFGRVFEVVNIHSSDRNEKYAMKIEILKSRRSEATGRLPHEDRVISDIRQRGHVKHMVEIVDRGPLPEGFHCSQPTQYVVMTLLGPNLVDLADMLPKKAFSAQTMAALCKQTLEAVQSVHECGYLHRDIKPANFVVGLQPHKHEVYLIDFGFARKFVDDRGDRMAPRPKAPFRGTAPYVSYNAFNCREQAPADDLWSLFYTLIDLRTGSLPWGRLVRSSMANEYKHHVNPTEWLKDIEPQYLTFYEFLTSMHYDMYPDYAYLHVLIDDLMKSLHVTAETPFDWEFGGNYYSKFKKRLLRKVFSE